MKKTALALLAGLAIVVAPGSVTSEPAKPYEPGLVEFMMHVQTHHAKLWLAGNARNWELADYQVDELKELLEDIAKRIPVYKEVPVSKLIEATAMVPIGDVEAAIKARACNSCHEAANRGFIIVQRPATSSFPNQSFAPRKK
jgi:hypothetical protein